MGIGQGIFIINTHDILQEIHMLKVLMVHHIDFPGHAQILYGKSYQLALLQFVCTGASCQNGHAEIPAHQILDGSYIIYFQYDINSSKDTLLLSR